MTPLTLCMSTMLIMKFSAVNQVFVTFGDASSLDKVYLKHDGSLWEKLLLGPIGDNNFQCLVTVYGWIDKGMPKFQVRAWLPDHVGKEL
ncbi:hypothetical protein V6N11_034042 [Hibiscus sabdariffa]|uniref:PLAT domain-containing protein n=1 Tax=Hibiscus sabdariffa TaxID=183260 RepID=A0ABR2S219_9ROSI